MDLQKTVLVIDDDQKFSFGLVAVLRRQGFRVITAFTGAEGLSAARSEKLDLILCDIMMPPPNGIQLKKELANDDHAGKIPFLFLTARTGKTDRLVCLESGADDYLIKPFDVNELLARIQAILRRHEIGYQQGVQDTSIAMDTLRKSISTNLSHEMRTPLTVLLSTLDLVIHEKFTVNNIELANYIKRANHSAYRLKFLVEDLEMLHAIDEGKPNTLNQKIDLRFHLKDPIEQVLNAWEHKSITMNYAFHPGTIIYAPRNDFSHVIAHLVDNACKFSPQGGQVQISLKPNGIGGCIFEVTDRGIGIPVELREKVFERYYQISQGDCREYGGLGIGLTIARAFAQALHGEIQIMDSPLGCRVRMILPAYSLD